jgi:hypothetical protein
MAGAVETELHSWGGGVTPKYKARFRTLHFNLKDVNNPDLRRRVLSGEIAPQVRASSGAMLLLCHLIAPHGFYRCAPKPQQDSQHSAWSKMDQVAWALACDVKLTYRLHNCHPMTGTDGDGCRRPGLGCT